VVLEVQKAPVSEVDPLCREFFEDPFPAHEELREAGPVVRLSRRALQQHITRISQPSGYRAPGLRQSLARGPSPLPLRGPSLSPLAGRGLG
jgi:hypothetical protein